MNETARWGQPKSTADAVGVPHGLECSFCNESPGDPELLIQGETLVCECGVGAPVFICPVCIAACNLLRTKESK